MATTRDIIFSQIPGHIREDYPRFCAFLEAYYSWLGQPDNPYHSLKYHMDYLGFVKSSDVFVDEMIKEYLTDVPNRILADKELFIKWSKDFHLSRGSHQSYKFLFKVLFNEQQIDIYLPKDNIMRTSDGTWIKDEQTMLITNTDDIQSRIVYQVLRQRLEVAPNIFTEATAVVQRSRNIYSGRYNLLALTVTDIVGDFDFRYPVETDDGISEYLVPTVGRIDVDVAGTGYTPYQRVFLTDVDEFTINRVATENNKVDTQLTTFIRADDIDVFKGTTQLTEFVYDGRCIFHPSIVEGDTITIRLPPYQGYLIVDSVDQNGGVAKVKVLDPPIGISSDCNLTTINTGFGQDFEGCAKSGAFTPKTSYYLDTKGHLSSTMYLQDSRYYQEYSYAIKTKQQIADYTKTVQDVLHPSGFAMFGIMNISYLLEILLSLEEEVINILPTEIHSLPCYGLGANYSFRDKFRKGLSSRLYKDVHFEDKPFVQSILPRIYMEEDIISNTGDYVLNTDQFQSLYSYRYDVDSAIGFPIECGPITFNDHQIDIVGDQYYDSGYKDIDYYESYIKYGGTSTYHVDGYYEFDNYYELVFEHGLGCRYKLINNKNQYNCDFYDGVYYTRDFEIGYVQNQFQASPSNWMTAHYLTDYHLYIPQEYSDEVESGFNYFETGYVSPRIEA